MPNLLKDYTGKKYGRLECLSFSARVEGNTYWTCKCDCGQLVDVRIRYLIKGSISSCGCLKQARKRTNKPRLSELKDFTGQRFGRLECISPSEPARVNGCTYWRCKCDCGKIVDKNIGNVVAGRIKSCGCLQSPLKNYSGQKFGHLECISPSEPAMVNGVAYWKFKCDCGKIVDKNIANVKSGNIKSCGCLKSPLKDYSGQKFGHLECISPSEPARVNGATYRQCKCDCGNLVDVNIASVVHRRTRSCGCLKQNNNNNNNNKAILYYLKNPFVQNKEALSLELKAGDKIGVFFYDNPYGSKAEIHNISKVTKSVITLENGIRYSAKGKKIHAFGDDASYLCSVQKAESLIPKQQQRDKESFQKYSKDYKGQKFGCLECISIGQLPKFNGETYWQCKCDCGAFVDVRLRYLIEGIATSCGCLNQRKNKVVVYNVKNPCAENQQVNLTLELKAGDKIGIFFYDKPDNSKAEIHVISKVTYEAITLEDGTRYNRYGKEMGATSPFVTYLCTVEQAERLISKQQQRILNKANVERAFEPPTKDSQLSKAIVLEQLHKTTVEKASNTDVIVEYLKRHGGATCTQIATDTNIGFNAVVCILNQLIKKDIVKKLLPKQNGQLTRKAAYTFCLVKPIDNS